VLLYVGSFRPNKGQAALLRKLKPESLGPYTLEFYGLRQAGQESAWNEVARLAEMPRLRGKVVIRDARVSHEKMMRAMARASGLVHYATQDRNPRVLYEALYFGLPLFVATQAMPYVGLQCRPFVALSDARASADVLNADLSAFTTYLAQDRGDAPLQVAIRSYVERELLAQKVYEQLCARLGLCDPACFPRSRTPWAKGKCARRDLVRYENWVSDPWDASKAIKKPLRINTDNKNHCYALNARAQERYGGFSWWSPSRYPKVKVDTEGAARCAAVNERRRSRRWNNVE